MLSTARAERHAVGSGEGGHDQGQLPQAAAKKEKPDEKQQVIRADQDVMDAGREELPDHCHVPCRDPAK